MPSRSGSRSRTAVDDEPGARQRVGICRVTRAPGRATGRCASAASASDGCDGPPPPPAAPPGRLPSPRPLARVRPRLAGPRLVQDWMALVQLGGVLRLRGEGPVAEPRADEAPGAAAVGES